MPRSITSASEHYKLAFAASIGGILELYEFLIYTLMASYIAEHFFATDARYSALVGTFATVAVGYFARPFGGVFFGRYVVSHSRKAAFTLSVCLLAISTVLVGCLPGYEVIGWFAPACLIVLRLGQGFAMGGEIPAAITYLSENSERQGLIVAIFFLSLMLGIAFGAMVHGVLMSTLTREQMFGWGWRVPFLLSGVLAGISYWARWCLNKSGFFLPLAKARQNYGVAVKDLFRHHFVSVLYGTLIMMLCATTVMTYGVYIHIYLPSLLGFSKHEVAWHAVLAFLVLSPLSLLSGLCCDLFNRKILVIVLALVLLILTWPTFQYFISDDAKVRKIMMISALYTGLASGLLPPILANLFPKNVRYTGVAITYNAGYMLVGGSVPLLSTILIKEAGLAGGPAICMMVSAALCLLTVFLPLPDLVDREE